MTSADTQAAAGAPDDVPRAPVAGITVLIVDDDAITVRLVSQQLKALGYEPLIAQDGMQAVMVAMRARPAAILLDINMPGGNGLTVLRRIRSSSWINQTPVLVMTAAGAKMEPGARQAGCDEFLLKPLSYQVLGQTLDRFLAAKADPCPSGVPA